MRGQNNNVQQSIQINRTAKNACPNNHQNTKHCPVTDKGLPRPLIEYKPNYSWSMHGLKETDVPKKMVVAWLNGELAKENNFTGFDDKKMKELHENNYMLCGTCSKPLGKTKIYGSMSSPAKNRTSGPAMHPKCALLAYHYCPHLKSASKPFLKHEGSDSGLDFEPLEEIKRKHPDFPVIDENGIYDISDISFKEEVEPLTIENLKEIIAEEKVDLKKHQD